MSDAQEVVNLPCWICGAPALSREHFSKKSDLREVFGNVSQTNPVFFQDVQRFNRPVYSLGAKILKFDTRICAHCNTTRTQPHDRAWEKFSAALRVSVEKMRDGSFIRGNTIFPYDTRAALLNVHLYFAKLFGCLIVEHGIPIDIKPFAAAIMNARAHHQLYLKFGKGPFFNGDRMTGITNMQSARRIGEPQLSGAAWLYCVEPMAVQITYAEERAGWRGLADAWHPSDGTTRLGIFDFDKDFGGEPPLKSALGSAS